jgi:hypothetical protein
MDIAPVMTASVVGVAQAAQAEPETGVVSFRADVPEALLNSMAHFIDAHPNGVQSRAVTRCYVANMFQRTTEGRSDQVAPARPPRSSLPTISR